jgi:hypothetical protein
VAVVNVLESQLEALRDVKSSAPPVLPPGISLGLTGREAHVASF